MTDEAFEKYQSVWTAVHNLVDKMLSGEAGAEDIRDKLADEFRFWKRSGDDISAAPEQDEFDSWFAHCDRCGKKLGGEGGIHICSPQQPAQQENNCGEKLGDVHTCSPRGIEVSVVYHEGMKMFAVPVQPAPPPWWPAVANILKEYGLQAIDFVADFKQALAEQPEHHDPIGDAQDKLIAEQAAQPYKGIADQVTNGRMRIDPVTGDVGIGTPSPQPAQQEPAGWRPATFHRDNLTFNPGLPDEQTVKFWKLQGVEIEYCYTIPQPAQRTWVGLTDDEFEDIEFRCRSTPFGKIAAMEKVEAKLKEKNT